MKLCFLSVLLAILGARSEFLYDPRAQLLLKEHGLKSRFLGIVSIAPQRPPLTFTFDYLFHPRISKKEFDRINDIVHADISWSDYFLRYESILKSNPKKCMMLTGTDAYFVWIQRDNRFDELWTKLKKLQEMKYVVRSQTDNLKALFYAELTKDVADAEKSVQFLFEYGKLPLDLNLTSFNEVASRAVEKSSFSLRDLYLGLESRFVTFLAAGATAVPQLCTWGTDGRNAIRVGVSFPTILKNETGPAYQVFKASTAEGEEEKEAKRFMWFPNSQKDPVPFRYNPSAPSISRVQLLGEDLRELEKQHTKAEGLFSRFGIQMLAVVLIGLILVSASIAAWYFCWKRRSPTPVTPVAVNHHSYYYK